MRLQEHRSQDARKAAGMGHRCVAGETGTPNQLAGSDAHISQAPVPDPGDLE